MYQQQKISNSFTAAKAPFIYMFYTITTINQSKLNTLGYNNYCELLLHTFTRLVMEMVRTSNW